MIFSGHDYSIDCIKSINDSHFFTGSQDGNVALWNLKKKKPVATLRNPQGGKWITALV
jgi:ribosomal RNA-processing protein 9